MKISKSQFASFIILSTLSFSAAYARDNDEHQKRHEKEESMNQELREKVAKFKPKPTQIASAKKPTKQPLTTIACGDVITTSITVGNDLNCTDSGFALRIIGNNIVVNGNGHKISAPNAAAGIYVEGNTDTVANFSVQGTQGYGLMAYNASHVQILSNNFSYNSIGIMIYADNGDTTAPIIRSNIAMYNSFAAIRTYSDVPGSITNPLIQYNDFRFSGNYAIYVKAKSYTISGSDQNNLSGSQNGYYLKDGDFKIQNLTMINQLISKRHFFADSAQSVSFNAVDVSTIAPASLTQERAGIDLYRVQNFSLNEVRAYNHDVALKLETENGISPQGVIHECLFGNDKFAGVYIVSYDNTHYGTIKFVEDNFKLVSGVPNIVLNANTVANIVISKNDKNDESDLDDKKRK